MEFLVATFLGVVGLAMLSMWRKQMHVPRLHAPGDGERVRLQVLLEKRERRLRLNEELLVATERLLGPPLEHGYREPADPFESRFRARTRVLWPRVRESFDRCRDHLDGLKIVIEGSRLSRDQSEMVRKSLLYAPMRGDPDGRPLLAVIRGLNRDWCRLAMMLDLIHRDISRDAARRLVSETLRDVKSTLAGPIRADGAAALEAVRARIETALAEGELVAAVEELPELQRQIGTLGHHRLVLRIEELGGKGGGA